MGGVDDYMPPYREVDHQTLWSQLEKPAGDPDQVAGLNAAWVDPIRATLDDFVLDLDGDLTDLMENYWSVTSAGGREFKRRMELVVKFADELSAHVGTISENLTAWEGSLRTAQGNAPDPEETDDNGRAVAGAAIGTAVAGPVGGVIGGLIGHSQDEEQKKEAHEKIVLIIATLAKDYDTAQQIKPPPPLPPVDLPDATDNGSSELTSITGAPVPTAEPFTPKPATTPGTHDINGPGDGTGPGTGPGDPNFTGDGSGLLGAGPGTITGVGVGTTGSLGLAGTGGGGALLGGAGGAGAGLFPGAAGAAAGAHGMNNGGLAGAKGGGGGSATTAKPASGPNPPPQNRGRGGTPTGQPSDGDDDTYMTWLTEDDMVWGNDADAPPTLLSKRRRDDEAVTASGDFHGEDDGNDET
ncbi:hypothetical protein [Phytomonospora endophytica]|uniref:WXG100 family type VII secretion target n=1 Tax=Phytomonospora endophytica TaxID=714109 RepID=A0A841FBW2_9ACTN|nr:hypothetical protein [Phytomonospora endophytica]MBB6032855.1 hypothetical protein [Phytomonospora endophytica]GIG65081.1 hypothetical protein Pen01_13760 [Phytomonospora endophytica]